MPNNTTGRINSEEELPFFARFLVEQTSSDGSSEEESDEPLPSPPPIYTLKFPSDWEDR